MSRRAAWRCAAAMLPFVAFAASAVERIDVPVTENEPEPPKPMLAVPEWMRPFGVETWWDVVSFSRWNSSIGLTFDDQEQRLRSPGTPTQRFSTRLWSEDFTIRNDAISILDPNLFTSSLSLGLLLQQQKQRATEQSTSQNGHLVNYAFDGIFFPQSAYNLTVSALRNQSTYVLPSGTTTESEYGSRAIGFRMREDNFLREREWLPYFNANLRVLQQDQKQVTRTEGQTFKQHDRQDSISVDFQNGGQTSDLGFQYQYNRLQNFAYSPGSYTSHSANLGYSLDFGPTLNRRWDSRINYYTRKGEAQESDLTNLDITENLAIDHSVERSSSYNYQLTRQETPFGVVSTHAAGARVLQQVYNNFSAAAGVTGLYTSLPVGTITSTGANANASYTRALPAEGHLSMTLGGGYVVTSNRVPSGVVQVTDAPFAVPQAVGAGSAILLKDRNIVLASIVVVVIKGGARVQAVLDVDYSIRVDGDRTSILPFASSAVMQPGDPLNVSYTFEVSPSLKYATTSRSGSISADWAWIGASASRDQSEQRPVGGGDITLLLDERRNNAMIWLRGNWYSMQGRADAGWLRYDSTRLAYTERRLNQYVSWMVRQDLQLNLSANEYRTEFQLPEHITTGGGARLDLQWNRWNWLTTAYLSRRIYRDTLQPKETVDEAGLRLRRSWTKLELSIALGAQKRERGDVSSVNGFVHFGAVRRF